MAELTLSTIRLQNAVSRAMKGAGYNKLLPITSMIGIEKNGNSLRFTTTDGNNYLYVTMEVDGDAEFDITVDAETFSKLVSKLTSEEITLDVTNNYLFVRGNGDYKIALQLDDEGSVLTYPNTISNLAIDVDGTDAMVIKKTTVDMMLNSLKPSLSQNIGSIYAGYFVGDIIASSDRAMLCTLDDNIFNGATQDLIFSRSFVDLLGLALDDISVDVTDEYMIASSGDITICSKLNTNTSEFHIEKIKQLVDIELDSFCRVNKQSMLSTLERLAIFVGKYDDSAINMRFDDSAVEFVSLNNDGVELVNYMESKDVKELEIKIDINRLITQLKAYSSDSVDIYYGDKGLLKLKDGKLTQIIALMV